MKNSFKFFLSFLLFFTFLLSFTRAESNTDFNNNKPDKELKIGLALSGGGSRGSAHIGFLKLLEKNQIKIDYIAGTSMGAIVGGLYASGMTPYEMEDWLNKIKWDDLLTDIPERTTRSYKNKKEDFDYIKSIEIGFSFSNGFMFPNGLTAGQKLIHTLRKLCLPVSNIKNFDDLPIPFRAISTNLETGERVILKQGSLADSIRASLSIPGIFAPYQIGGDLLIDGFVRCNLPIDVLKEMGADIIIAVDVRNPLNQIKELKSLFTITDQVLKIMTIRNTINQINNLSEDDIYIYLPMADINNVDFNKTHQFIEYGNAPNVYKHAFKKIQKNKKNKDLTKNHEPFDGLMQIINFEQILKDLGTDRNSYLIYEMNRRRFRQDIIEKKKIDHIPVSFVKINNTSRVNNEAILSKCDCCKKEKPFNLKFDDLKKDIMRIYDIGDFELVDAKPVQENNKWGIQINTRKKSWGPSYLNFGLDLKTDLKRESSFNIKLLHKIINHKGGSFNSEAYLGDGKSFNFEFYQPVDYKRNIFISPFVFYEKKPGKMILNNNSNLIDIIRNQIKIGMQIGKELSYLGRLSFAYSYGYEYVESFYKYVFNDYYQNINTGKISFNLDFDTLNSCNFPTKGFYMKNEIYFYDESFGSDIIGNGIKTFLSVPFTLKNTTINPVLYLNMPLWDELNNIGRESLGGFRNLSGLDSNTKYGKFKFLGKIIIQQEVNWFKSLPEKIFYAGITLETGSVWNDHSKIKIDDLMYGMSIFWGTNTIFGPLYIAAGLAERKNVSMYIHIGHKY